MSDPITPGDLLRLAANESIVSAVLKWAAANGRRLTKADLERMGQGVDAMVAENERLTKERDEALALLGCYKMDKDDLKARVMRLEAVTNDPNALWTNWLRGDVRLPVGIGDVRQYQDRIKRLEEALDLVRPHCTSVHHSKKHQHAYDQPCPVVALIKKAKEAKP